MTEAAERAVTQKRLYVRGDRLVHVRVVDGCVCMYIVVGSCRSFPAVRSVCEPFESSRAPRSRARGMVGTMEGWKAEMQIWRDSRASKAPLWPCLPTSSLLAPLSRLLCHLPLAPFISIVSLRSFSEPLFSHPASDVLSTPPSEPRIYLALRLTLHFPRGKPRARTTESRGPYYPTAFLLLFLLRLFLLLRQNREIDGGYKI